MATFQRGQILVGLRRSYRLINEHIEVQITFGSPVRKLINLLRHRENVVIKTASQSLLQNETKHLTTLQGHHRIRQIIHTIESPPSIVLEYMEEDLRSLSLRRKLQRDEIKVIDRQLFEALSFAHSKNIIHTDMKPQNILLSGFADNCSCSEISVKLADWANVSYPSDYKISPKSFRSPESWLGLPCGPGADIWSFGAIALLMMGPHGELFGSSAQNEEDAEIEMLRKQNSMTGPYLSVLLERAGGDWLALFQVFADIERDQGYRISWKLVMEEVQIPEEDGAFVERDLKIDPAERPTADTLLTDKWLR